jgi:outer membrane murein-binding lipoprotein Lpp
VSEKDDFAEELRGDGDDVSNTKQGSLGQVVLAGLIIAVGSWGLGKATDSSRETQTAAAVATLTERVSTLTDQVRRLNDQPYATRSDLSGLSSRVDGLAERIGDLERATRERGKR